jgi:ribosomal protein S14
VGGVGRAGQTTDAAAESASVRWDEKESAMKTMRGEVNCLICGRFLGVIEDSGGRLRMVRAGSGGVTPKVSGGKLRCGRCGGRAIIETSMDSLYAA